MCNDLVVSGRFFQYSYLYTEMITIFFVGEAGHFFLAGGSFYPLNTLDRILTGIWGWLTDADLTGG